MKLKLLYFFIFIGLLLFFFLKTTTIYFLEKSLTKSMKKNVEITSFSFYPLQLDAIITVENLPEGVIVHAEYAGGLSIKPKSIGKYIITSTSLGGFVHIDYEHYTYNIKVIDVDFKKLAIIFEDKKIVKSGKVNGTMVYYKKPRTGSSNLKITEVVLNMPDIDKTLTNVNDALNFNLVHLFSVNVDKSKKLPKETKVDHFQFDITLRNDMITAKDVALRTKNYRISIVANLHKKGAIKYFYTYLLDKNGCSIVTQSFSGNIRDPERKTSTSVVNVVQSSPTSFFGMGQQMMRYGNKYSEQAGFKSQSKQMSSYMIKESDYLFGNVSKIVLPQDCSVIYRGIVKHPADPKKALNNTNKDSNDIQKALKNLPIPYQGDLLP